MTKQEAIDLLDNLIGMIEDNHGSDYDSAIRMAIDALTEPDCKAIEDEVWELADYMCRMGVKERDLCFGFQLTTEVTANLSYQEAKSKFEAWLKQNDEIHVGDEVETESGNKACVLYENPDGTQMFVFKVDGTAAWWSKCAIHKTGKNHPEVAELLEKMRGEQDAD